MTDDSGSTGRRTLDTRMAAAINSAPCGLLMSDANGRIHLVNGEIERLFGYSRDELVGQQVELLVPARHAPAHPQQRESFMAAPAARAMGAGRDLFGRRKDGSEVPIEIGLTPVETEDGLFVISSIVDISARKRADDQFRIAVESSPSGMVMIDQTGKIILVNRETERLFGYHREELLGHELEMLVPARFRRNHPGSRTAFFTSPHPRAMGAGRELFGLRKDGTEVPIEIGLNPIETKDGTLVLASVVDITARREAERERHALEEQLRQSQKMEALGRLAGGVAHDFNNVLAAILGLVDLAIEDPTNALEDLRELQRAADRGRLLVGQILRFGRRENSPKVPVDLAASLEETMRLLRTTLAPNIEISTAVAAGLPRIHADPTAITQIVMNLATNGAHAMPNGGRLAVSVDRFYVRDSVARAHPQLREGDHLALKVADNGRGMDPETIERAFEPFFTTKAAGEGSGLGLAIVHAAVHDHGGATWIESAAGRGTVVTCLLPAMVDTQVPQIEAPTAPQVGRGERVLCIDDEPVLGRITQRRLEMLGYRVKTLSDPSAALHELSTASEPYALVLSDRAMPRLGGIELARMIRDRHPNLPIVLMSGWVEDLDSDTITAAGITAVVGKPAEPVELAKIIRSLLDPADG